MTRRWMALQLEAPMLSFGGLAIDHIRPTFDFPAISMLTGLFANALGWRRSDRAAHQELQDRLVFGARQERAPYLGRFTDLQNARLGKSDKGWTTSGQVEGRAGGSYNAPHQRFRDYHPDARVLVVVRLDQAADESETETIDLEGLAQALDRPARPLFIGRKPCIPVTPIRFAPGGEFLEADNVYAALEQAPLARADRADQLEQMPAIWPAGEGPEDGPTVDRALRIADRRNWLSGLHGGDRLVFTGRVEVRPR